MLQSGCTLVYDGDCGFCTTSATWIARRWPEGGPTAVPWQRLPTDVIAEAGLTPEDLQRAAWWIDGDSGEEGARAVARALGAASGPCALLGSILLVPPVSWVAAAVYRLVARFRHRLPGATPTCRV